MNMGWNVVGGVRMDAEEKHLNSIYQIIKNLEEEYDKYVEMFEEGPLLALRSKDVGKMSKKDAIKGRAVGPIGRGSGLKHDAVSYTHLDVYKRQWFSSYDCYFTLIWRCSYDISISWNHQPIRNRKNTHHFYDDLWFTPSIHWSGW